MSDANDKPTNETPEHDARNLEGRESLLLTVETFGTVTNGRGLNHGKCRRHRGGKQLRKAYKLSHTPVQAMMGNTASTVTGDKADIVSCSQGRTGG